MPDQPNDCLNPAAHANPTGQSKNSSPHCVSPDPCAHCDQIPRQVAPSGNQPGFDCRQLRSALASFATGIAVVTAARADGSPVGLTINSFNSVSLEPPLILWSLALTSPHLATFRQCSHYAVNILAADQEALSNSFAQRGNDKFGRLVTQPGHGNSPLLAGCCATFECSNHAQYPGGDHLIFVGQIERLAHHPQRPPLLYHAGNYAHLDQPITSVEPQGKDA